MTRKPNELHNRLVRELEIGLDDADFEILDAVEIASRDGEGWEPSSAAALYRLDGGVALYLSFAIEKSGGDPETMLHDRIEHYRSLVDETERLLRRYRELQVDAALSGVPDVPPVPGDEMPEDKPVTGDHIASIDLSRRLEDVATLRGELSSVGIIAKVHAPRKIGAREVREQTGLSQDAFALRYGLDVSTLRDWERDRSEPDAAATTLLWIIARNPSAVEQSIDMEEPDNAEPAYGF